MLTVSDTISRDQPGSIIRMLTVTDWISHGFRIRMLTVSYRISRGSRIRMLTVIVIRSVVGQE